MKKFYTLLLLAGLTLVACSKSDDAPEMAFELEATGTVADQTPEEAKKTINGKWTVGGASGKSFAAKGQNCTFLGIEFTDDRYAIAIGVAGEDEPAVAYGTYELSEGSDGTVRSVDLYENVDGTNYKIATLTDIVVEESGNELRATFDVVFNIPDDYEDWPCGNSLSGDYSAEKEEPVNGAENADEDSNFALLVNTWTASAYSNSEGASLEAAFQSVCYDLVEDILDEIIEENAEEISLQIEAAFDAFVRDNGADALTQEVMDAIADGIVGELQGQFYETALARAQAECEPAARLEVSFSAYGSYTFVYFGQDGSVLSVDVDDWEFNNADQTELLVDGEFIINIQTLNDTTFVGTTDDGEGFTETYTFTRSN